MIIFINGSINSGKSTIAKLLQKELGNSALVEIDSLRHFIDWLPIDKSISFNLQNAVSVIKNFVKGGLNVIVPYPISENNYKFFKESLLGLNEKLVFLTLSPTLEVALSDRGNRKLSSWEKQRINHHYKIGIPNLPVGLKIDNSKQNPEETVSRIIEYLEK